MNTSIQVRFLPAGDAALVIEFGEHVDRDLSERVLRLSDRIRAAALPGIVETVPTYRSLAVHYSPLATTAKAIRNATEALLDYTAGERAKPRLWRVPACYHASHAPDLAEVAKRTGLSLDGVVARHAETIFHVYMLGFAPGFPYMGDLPPELALPRRTDPRIRVPPGSVAIATSMTAVYPLESPGGWHLIGATPVRLFDLGWEEPALLRPGDAVRFEPIASDAFDAIRSAVARGEHRLAPESGAS